MEPAPLASPPRARLAFRVGVVGHRPNRLEQADLDSLGRLIRKVLLEVRWTVDEFASRANQGGILYSKESPVLRAITPLAEGTDRLFADQALDLGYALCCPMPFHQEEYERDFVEPEALDADSLKRFHDLLGRARAKSNLTTFQLDGDPANRAAAYGAAGRIVLNQSDLLIVVWDGAKASGAGGTVDTLREAIRYRVPVLWIDAVRPHPWRLLSPGDDLNCLESDERCTPVVGAEIGGKAPGSLARAIRKLVLDEIELPKGSRKAEATAAEILQDNEHPTYQEYFRERKPRAHLAILWKFFRDLVGSGKLSIQPLRVTPFEEALTDWPIGTGSEPEPVAEWVNRRLRPHYAWADKLADTFADYYRGTYIFVYLFSAFAVFLALLPYAANWGEEAPERILCIIGEFVIMIGITGLLGWEKKRAWHKRWMAYRLLAETIRQLRCLAPLGGGRPLPRVPPQQAVYGDPAQTWMYWQLRAVARSTGIPAAEVTPRYVRQALEYLDLVVRGQLDFHILNESRSEHISHRLHLSENFLFGATVLCVFFHLLPHFPFINFSLLPEVERWLTLACATLPAFGAAMAGINNQGEFLRIAKRSASMAHALERFTGGLKTLLDPLKTPPDSLRINQVTPLALEIAQLMVDEVLDWRVVFMDRPAPTP